MRERVCPGSCSGETAGAGIPVSGTYTPEEPGTEIRKQMEERLQKYLSEAGVMSRRAAELLAGNGYAVDTGFHVSYSMVIMGILILFAAEVFAIGQNLSEEQKLTI